MQTLTQSVLFPDIQPQHQLSRKTVNVTSVPHRSPFRYPGGKTWFVPIFREWIFKKKNKPTILVEPFTGGGIISLTALFENLVDYAVMAELDDDVAAVWKSIINGDAQWIAQKILSFELSKEAVTKELSKPPKTIKEKAFQTILKNRTYHGGILANGSGLIKNGENKKGISSRWYPKTLANRLINLNHIKDRIKFVHNDGLEVLKQFSDRKDAVFFIDPPYTAGGKMAGKRLYKHHQLNHEYLFKLCSWLQSNFLITYDDASEVRNLSNKYNFQMRLVPMKNTHHAKLTELVIAKDLSWMNGFSKPIDNPETPNVMPNI